MSQKRLRCFVAGGALWLGAACADVETESEDMDETPAAVEEVQEPTARAREDEEALRAVAQIQPKSGSDLSGEAFFVAKDDDTVNFGIYLEDVSPGTHAVHIHEFGDCSAPDASSAGDHWNPTYEAHGKWGEEPFHLGDIGNIEINEDGDGTLSFTTDRWNLENGERSVLGKAIVVHAGADDFTTQPDGAAGDRIGCGVIEWKGAAPDPTD